MMNQPLLLIVDDEAGVRQSLQMVFNKNFRVLEAKSADETLQKVADEEPDVVLLDIVMPGDDGLAVLKCVCITGKEVDQPGLGLHPLAGFDMTTFGRFSSDH